MEFLFGDPANRNSKYLVVNLSVPKFDVSSDLRLENGLQDLGITKVFHTREADFSPLSDRDDLFLGAVNHAVRVAVDEDGCTAAAYTASLAVPTAPASTIRTSPPTRTTARSSMRTRLPRLATILRRFSSSSSGWASPPLATGQ